MFNKIPTQSIHAVHDDDLEKVLERLKLLKDFQSGQISCKFCKIVITPKNLYSLFPQSGSVKFVCEKETCVKELYGLLQEGQINL